MSLYKNSTKLNPLLFFATFINDETLTEYETMFYGDWGNPSQISSKHEGFIEYLKDNYNETTFNNIKFTEQSTIKEFFADSLSKLLYANVSKSIAFLEKRSLKLEYLNIKLDTYLLSQLTKIHNLKDSISEDIQCGDIIKEVLYTLEKKIKAISKLSLIPERKHLRLTNSTYFEIKPSIKKSTLKKLYNIAIAIDLIDDEKVDENEFINFFMSSNPSIEGYKIIFKANNQQATLFLDSISHLFEKLTDSQISMSKSLYKKNGTMFNAGDLYSARNRYKNKMSTDLSLLKISKSVQSILSQK